MAVPPISSERLDLVSMSPHFISAVLAGRRAEAERLGQLCVVDNWPDEADSRFLRLRLEQMQADPSVQVWLARAMVLRDPARTMAGHIGFHGPPEQVGRAELGYTVFPDFRRRGLATEAATTMMKWAQLNHGVERFVVSISPDNAPSLAMATKLGFTQIGEQIDEVDGLELVFELIVA
jgi:ribosomal-protein-alanine N-acetyltransferase